jgi:hypothetical protein
MQLVAVAIGFRTLLCAESRSFDTAIDSSLNLYLK